MLVALQNAVLMTKKPIENQNVPTDLLSCRIVQFKMIDSVPIPITETADHYALNQSQVECGEDGCRNIRSLYSLQEVNTLLDFSGQTVDVGIGEVLHNVHTKDFLILSTLAWLMCSGE